MVNSLLDLPNVGRATAADLDPCVIDVFLSLVSFAKGGPAKPWWDFTAERQKAAQSVIVVRSTNLKR